MLRIFLEAKIISRIPKQLPKLEAKKSNFVKLYCKKHDGRSQDDLKFRKYDSSMQNLNGT